MNNPVCTVPEFAYRNRGKSTKKPQSVWPEQRHLESFHKLAKTLNTPQTGQKYNRDKGNYTIHSGKPCHLNH